MITSQKGIELIKEFEGLELKAYRCPAGVLTIGYGHTQGVKQYDVVTEAQAECMLKADLIPFEQDITRLVKVDINQNQFDALVSFVFNLGTRALSTSTLLRRLNSRDYKGAANEFPRWSYAKKVFMDGLRRRRIAEKDLFNL